MGMGEFFHENRPGLCAVGVAAGVPLTLISILSLAYVEGDTGLKLSAYELVGNWAFWLILPALAMTIIGGYYLNDYRVKVKEFNELMKTESKAKFIKNIDRIELLAWSLHPKYEKMVIERKSKYKIR